MHAHTSSSKPVFLINSRPRNNKSTGSFGPTLFCRCCRCSLLCRDSLRQKHACMDIHSGGCVCTGRHTATMHRTTCRHSIAVPLSISRAKEKPGRADPTGSKPVCQICQRTTTVPTVWAAKRKEQEHRGGGTSLILCSTPDRRERQLYHITASQQHSYCFGRAIFRVWNCGGIRFWSV